VNDDPPPDVEKLNTTPTASPNRPTPPREGYATQRAAYQENCAAEATPGESIQEAGRDGAHRRPVPPDPYPLVIARRIADRLWDRTLDVLRG
jgi:hypothetical protein